MKSSAWTVRRVGAAAAMVSALGCSGGSHPERSPGELSRPAASTIPELRPDADGGALRVTLYGIGPVRAGMSVDEAASALGAALLLPDGADAVECNYLKWPGGPTGVAIMVEQRRVARIEVRSGAIATEAGVRIGDPADRVRQLYAGRVTASPHKYTVGQYLTVASASASDGEFRLVFETEAERVTRYRSGRVPQVEYVEGCS